MRSSSRAAAFAFVLVTAFALPAFAVGEPEASGTAKGTIGGALLGAELVLGVEAAFDVEPTWLYIVGGSAGAVGGGVGGYFIEQSASPRVSMLMLAGGLTLAIPTTVAVLSATAYEPPVEYLEDSPPPDEPAVDAPEPSQSPADAAPPGGAKTDASKRGHAYVKRSRERSAAKHWLRLSPPGLLDITPERIALSIPALEVRDVYTQTELLVFGVRQATEVRASVLSVAF